MRKLRLNNLQLDLSLSRNQIRNWAALMLVAYLAKFAYVFFPEVNYETQSYLLKDFYPWLELKHPKMDDRNYVYLAGERFFNMIHAFAWSRVIVCWQTLTLWVFEVLYIFDFILTYHSIGFGTVKTIIMCFIFAITIIRLWKSSY